MEKTYTKYTLYLKECSYYTKNAFHFLYYGIKKLFCRHHYKQIGVMSAGYSGEDCIIGKVYHCDKCGKRKHTEVKYLWKDGCELVGSMRSVKPGDRGQIKLRYRNEVNEVSIVRKGDKYLNLKFSDGSVGQFSFCYIAELVLW